MMAEQVPGPPSPPITPGANGWPSREELKAMVETLGIFEWCEANGLLEEWSGELRRARDAFMFAHGPTVERWLNQEEAGGWGPAPPNSLQFAGLIKEADQLRAENRLLRQRLGDPAAFIPEQMVSARDFQRSIESVVERLHKYSTLLVLKRGKPLAVLSQAMGEGK